MRAIHLNPYDNVDPYEQGSMFCGVKGGYEEPLNTTSLWKNTTCKKCLSQKERITNEINEIEKTIVKQMGEFVEFNKIETKESES